MELNRTAPLKHYVLVVMNLEHNSPLCVQSIVRKLHDAGHQITLFAHTPKGKLVPILEDPAPLPATNVYERPQDLLRDKTCKSDAVILITDRPVYEVPNYLQCECVIQHFNGHIYSWNSYGLTCSLLGGLVHNRRVAIQIRWLLEDSQKLLVGRILPQPCFFDKLYSVNPIMETAEPCVM